MFWVRPNRMVRVNQPKAIDHRLRNGRDRNSAYSCSSSTGSHQPSRRARPSVRQKLLNTSPGCAQYREADTTPPV